MKHTVALALCLASRFLPTLPALALGAILLNSGAAEPSTEPAYYPWSESSDHVRVPKSFLSQITVQSVTMTGAGKREYSVKDEFIQIFKLTHSEVEEVTKALADALHEYRLEETRHLQPIEEEIAIGPRGFQAPKAVEKFSFRLTPFPEEARAIRKSLEERLLKVLGPERSRPFWQSALMIEGEMSTFAHESPVRADMVRETTFTFQLTEHANLGLLVDRYKSTMTRRLDGAPGGGGGSSGITFTENLDPYAPVSLKPALKRWRKAVADSANDSSRAPIATAPSVAPVERSVTTVPQARKIGGNASSTQPTDSTPPNTRWDDNARFMDIPKDLIATLHVTGLTPNEEIAPEAATLFGLGVEEQNSVRKLYDGMKTRFLQLERAHFQRIAPDKSNFVLRAFPEKSGALQKEWVEKLKQLLGSNRGEMLDRSIRTQSSPFRAGPRGARPMGNPRFFQGGPGGPFWLHSGDEDIQVELSSGPGRPDGQPSLRIEHRSLNGRGGSGAFEGSPDRIPERWRHLITPELLGIPLAL